MNETFSSRLDRLRLGSNLLGYNFNFFGPSVFSNNTCSSAHSLAAVLRFKSRSVLETLEKPVCLVELAGRNYVSSLPKEIFYCPLQTLEIN